MSYILYFFLKKYFFAFEEMTRISFLFYSWLELRRLENFVLKPCFFSIGPVNKRWFFKASFLLRKGRYHYKKYKSINYKSISFSNSKFIFLKNKIIENAIFNIIFPFFQNNYLFKNYSLLQYVRLFLNWFFI